MDVTKSPNGVIPLLSTRECTAKFLAVVPWEHLDFVRCYGTEWPQGTLTQRVDPSIALNNCAAISLIVQSMTTRELSA